MKNEKNKNEEKNLYYPIFPDPKSLGSQRSDFVRKWVDNFLLPGGWATYDEKKANRYLVASGDSGLMGAARDKYRAKKVLVGVNCGTRGFLLNPITEINDLPLFSNQLSILPVKLMRVTFYQKTGKQVTLLAFNDVIIGGDIVNFNIFKITGEMRGFPDRKNLQGSGLVIATPQGTTGYALNILGSSVVAPLDTNIWTIAGLATGPYPNDHVQPQRIEIEISSRLPVNGYADGKAQEVKDINRAIIEPTNIVVSLGFIKSIDFEARRRELAQKVERGE